MTIHNSLQLYLASRIDNFNTIEFIEIPEINFNFN